MGLKDLSNWGDPHDLGKATQVTQAPAAKLVAGMPKSKSLVTDLVGRHELLYVSLFVASFSWESIWDFGSRSVKGVHNFTTR